LHLYASLSGKRKKKTCSHTLCMILACCPLLLAQFACYNLLYTYVVQRLRFNAQVLKMLVSHELALYVYTKYCTVLCKSSCSFLCKKIINPPLILDTAFQSFPAMQPYETLKNVTQKLLITNHKKYYKKYISDLHTAHFRFISSIFQFHFTEPIENCPHSIFKLLWFKNSFDFIQIWKFKIFVLIFNKH